MTKAEMINELMKDSKAFFPQLIIEKLNKRSKSTIEFYFDIQYRRGVPAKFVIDNIIRIG